ncbi:oxygenase MpaB family protein [Nocardioides halotolerans]|uniref:oxygenase MpaB family protein n=1 Tax=Nocardioides halotolerans TaxID=433660 RepID=UPI00040E6E7B|nr:oxygenase MpaB family protein [Nocardioides halotolerans]
MRLASRHRYDNLELIRTLDPYDDADRDRIVSLTGRHDFPWDFDQGTAIAFLRDYGIPSISRLLDRTREFEDHGVKRYDDTLFFQEEAILEGVDSERSHTAIRRLNRIHGHYDIPNDEFQYVLATTIVGPVRWIRRYGWRPLDERELVAMARFTTRFGELMGIKGLPETYEGYEDLLDSYEAERFAFDPANRRVTEATIRIGRATAPWYLKPGFRRVSIALMDEPLRLALGMEEQPRWLVRAVDLGLRLRARVLRFLPPRRAPYERTHPTYPNGYELAKIGPASMLDDLNKKERTVA